jgi:uncharacterized protein YciI
VPEFIYQFLAGDRPELLTEPDAWSEEDERASDEHYQRLAQATEDGIVILAGRSLDGIGPSVVILEADSEEDARRFMEADPFLTKGLFGASLHPFRAALVRDQHRPRS